MSFANENRRTSFLSQLEIPELFLLDDLFAVSFLQNLEWNACYAPGSVLHTYSIDYSNGVVIYAWFIVGCRNNDKRMK